MADSREKQHISLVVTGHIDAGKSTTTGHLIFKLGGINARDMAKLQEKADANGKSSFAFAYYMDTNKEERERGVTVNCNTKEFYTDSYHYSIVDAPGHRDYVKNMISGAGQADAALILIPAEKGGFEAAIAKGDRATGEVEGQTRQHARLLALLGIEKVIVGINKMDSCDWSQTRFDEIKKEMSAMLQQCGMKPKKIPFIPYSGFNGDNLTEPTDKMPWYDGWTANINPTTQIKGVTLLDALEKFVTPPNRIIDAPLRIPVSGVYNIKGVGAIITGRIEQGVAKVDDPLSFAPNNITGCKMFSMEMHHKKFTECLPGDNIGMSIKGLEKDNMPKAGDVIYKTTDGICKPVKKFTAMVSVQDHPGKLKPGFCPIIHVRTAKCSCKMTEINWKMGKKTGGTKLEKPESLERGENAEVVFEPSKPFFLEPYDKTPGLGRIAVMDSNSLVMLGKVLDVEYED
jgi:elongation factor 1-alpha|tara:strand:- start:1788 stop:3161 length:1374 start_codon:yes stop_codon:yes gene_type:complete